MLIISNYNHSISPTMLGWSADQDYIIYDQSETVGDINKSLFTNITPSLHSGHNLSDYFSFIISNWDNLPEINRFIKGNIVPRHIDQISYRKRINNTFYTSLFCNQDNRKMMSLSHLFRFKSLYPSFSASNGFHAEFNNNWYSHSKVANCFVNFDDLASHLFLDYKKLRYIVFIPSACSIVERSRIKYYPKKLYEFLFQITTYTLFPREAYHVERILHMLWQCTHSLKSNF